MGNAVPATSHSRVIEDAPKLNSHAVSQSTRCYRKITTRPTERMSMQPPKEVSSYQRNSTSKDDHSCTCPAKSHDSEEVDSATQNHTLLRKKRYAQQGKKCSICPQEPQETPLLLHD